MQPADVCQHWVQQVCHVNALARHARLTRAFRETRLTRTYGSTGRKKCPLGRQTSLQTADSV